MIPHQSYPSITYAALETELLRECGARERTYPRRVDKAAMSQDEADLQLAIARAWRADVARLAAWTGTGQDLPAATHGISWTVRHNALRRELALRDRHYPNWVDTARMTQDVADHRRLCVLALLAIYEDGFDFTCRRGNRPRLDASADRDQHAAAIEFFQMQLQSAARRENASIQQNAHAWLTHYGVDIAPTEQKEMAV